MFNNKFNMDKTESAIQSVRRKNNIKCSNNGRVMVYTPTQIEYLREIAEGTERTNEETTKMYNDKFNENKSVTAIAAIKNKHNILSFEVPEEYTQEQVDYIRKIAPNKTNKEITKIYNIKFGENRTESGISCIRNKNKIYTSDDGRFKKGEIPPNWVELGSERITRDGYIQIKVREGMEQKNWRGKHILVWEKVNGPLPESSAIIFGDKDIRNFDIDNLICVSRKQLLGLNRHDLIQDNAELTKVALNVVDLNYSISERMND